MFNNFTLNINHGDFTVLIGPSGSGKTTLLKILSGLMRFDEGDLKILNHNFSPNVYSASLFSKLRKYDLGIITQQWNLYPNSTILENFYLNYFLFKSDIRTSEIQQSESIFRKMLHSISLFYNTNRSIENLSWGEKQRLAIVLAILKHPKIILADEPTANLDAHSAEFIIDVFQYLNNQGITIIMATHDLSLIRNGMIRIPLGKYSEQSNQ
ncbi:MAG: ABC transporter ATP-binding protein [Candidatus Hodarchaeota archaeon]